MFDGVVIFTGELTNLRERVFMCGIEGMSGVGFRRGQLHRLRSLVAEGLTDSGCQLTHRHQDILLLCSVGVASDNFACDSVHGANRYAIRLPLTRDGAANHSADAFACSD